MPKQVVGWRDPSSWVFTVFTLGMSWKLELRAEPGLEPRQLVELLEAYKHLASLYSQEETSGLAEDV